MVLNVGLVSACIIYKNRPGAQTRLQKLQKRLKQKSILQKTLYSYPVKKMFSIVMILCFMLGLVLFLREVDKELKENNKYVKDQVQIHEQDKTHYIFPYKPLNLVGHSLKTSGNHRDSALIKSISNHHQYLKIQKTVYWLLAFFTIPLVVLLCSLQFQRVIVKAKSLSDPNSVSGYISKQKLSLLYGWTCTSESICRVDDTLVIELCGQERFSNTNYFYAVKKISKVQNRQEAQMQSSQQDDSRLMDEESTSRVHQEVIMQKGNIYEARQALIYLCYVLKKDINLSIKNGPVKEQKQKKPKTTKKTNKQQ